MKQFTCRICHSHLYETLFYWRIPLAADVKEQAWDGGRFELEPVMCKTCHHVQLKETIDLNLYENYLYTPSFSPTFKEYIGSLVKQLDLWAQCGNQRKKVLEIGSSNGYLLRELKSYGWEVLGFEPSVALSDAASQAGVPTNREYFTEDSVSAVVQQLGAPSVVIMRHVLEHMDDPSCILKAVSKVLENGLLVIEVPWLLKILEEDQFFAFYHEHISYFSISAIWRLLKTYHFRIIEISDHQIGGGSFVVFALKEDAPLSRKPESAQLYNYLQREEDFISSQHIIDFSNRAKEKISTVRDMVLQKRKEGKTLAAWGAGQGGCTLLNLCSLSAEEIEFVVDINPNYWNKFISGTDIPIVSPAFLKDHFVDEIIIFATSFADEIIDTNKDYLAAGGTFLNCL